MGLQFLEVHEPVEAIADVVRVEGVVGHPGSGRSSRFWPAAGLDPGGRLQLQLELARVAGEALRTNEVDIVMLNRAPPLLRHRAIRDSKLLVERDPVARVRLDARALLDYLDTKPLRAEMSRGLRKRIREDRFGRP